VTGTFLAAGATTDVFFVSHQSLLPFIVEAEAKQNPKSEALNPKQTTGK
jgi:hypothetical protein